MTISYLISCILIISSGIISEAKRYVRSSDNMELGLSPNQTENICDSCSVDDRTCKRETPIACNNVHQTTLPNYEATYNNYPEHKLHWRRKRDFWSGRRGRYSRFYRDYETHVVSTQAPKTEACFETKTFTCRYYKCTDVCCKGWTMDPVTNLCTVKTLDPVTLECYNGGTVMNTQDGLVCVCRHGFTGRHCETFLCYPVCQNDGLCDFIDGAPRCVCKDGYEGAQCEIPKCPYTCINGGVCVSGSQWSGPTCLCPEEYSGSYCQHSNYKEKPGYCPQLHSSMIVNAGVCDDTCYDDVDCIGTDKCCSTGCGMACMTPTDDFCRWNNTKYYLGETFQPTACLVCTCFDPNNYREYGGASCTYIPCPEVHFYCVNLISVDCCDTCIDGAAQIHLEGYKEPEFTNCPANNIQIDLPADSNSVHLPIKLKSQDYLRRDLDVTYSATTFTIGPDGVNYFTVLATSSIDVAGNRATCSFRIRLRDREPPVFTSCPSDITSTDERVGWAIPVAKDNVGLAIPPYSKNTPGEVFTRGEHTIVYKTADYEDNIANCIFLVKVITRKETKSQRRARLHLKSVKYYSGALTVVAVLIVAVIIIAIVRYKARQRRKPAEMPLDHVPTGGMLPGPETRPPLAPDNIYSIQDDNSDPPPPYDRVGKLKSMIDSSPYCKSLVETEYLNHPIPTIYVSEEMPSTSLERPRKLMTKVDTSPIHSPARTARPPSSPVRLTKIPRSPKRYS